MCEIDFTVITSLLASLSISVSHNSVHKMSHHKNTNEDPVNSRLMFSVLGCDSAPLNVCVIDEAANARLWIYYFSLLFFYKKQTHFSR